MTSEQLCLEYWKLIVTTFVAAVVGGFTIYVAWQQRNIAKRQAAIAEQAKQVAAAKLNYDLFVERYRLYALLRDELLQIVIARQNYDPGKSQYQLEVPKFAFLFGRDITDYLKKINDTHNELMSTWQRQPYTSEEERLNAAKLFSWMNTESLECYKRFKPYLDFSEWQAQDWARTRAS